MFRKLQGGAGTPALSWATGQKLKANGTKASKTIQILWRERLTSRYVIKGWRGGTPIHWKGLCHKGPSYRKKQKSRQAKWSAQHNIASQWWSIPTCKVQFFLTCKVQFSWHCNTETTWIFRHACFTVDTQYHFLIVKAGKWKAEFCFFSLLKMTMSC